MNEYKELLWKVITCLFSDSIRMKEHDGRALSKVLEEVRAMDPEDYDLRLKTFMEAAGITDYHCLCKKCGEKFTIKVVKSFCASEAPDICYKCFLSVQKNFLTGDK